MSIDDNLQNDNTAPPEHKGGPLDRLDSKLVKLHYKLGNFWQKKTHLPAESLERNLYGSTAIFFAVDNALSPDNYPYLIHILSVLSLHHAITGSTLVSKDSELEEKYNGISKKMEAYRTLKLITFLPFYCLGIASLGLGVSSIYSGIASKNTEQVKEGTSIVLKSLGLITYTAADYLHRPDYEPVPQK